MFPRGFINFSAKSSIENGKYYISSNDINALYQIDANLESVEYVGAFPNRSDIDKNYHVMAKRCGNTIFFVNRFPNQIDSFDEMNKSFDTIDFPPNVLPRSVSLRIFSDEVYIYFVPNVIGKPLLLFNLEKRNFDIRSGWLSKHAQYFINGAPFCYNRSICFDGEILKVHVRDTNIILYYDIRNDIFIKKIDIPHSFVNSGIVQIFYHGEGFGAVLRSGHVLLLNDDGSLIWDYSLCDKGIDFTHAFYKDNHTYIFFEGVFLVISKETSGLYMAKIKSNLSEKWIKCKEFYMHDYEGRFAISSVKNDELLVVENDTIKSIQSICYPNDEDLSWYMKRYKNRLFFEGEMKLEDLINAISMDGNCCDNIETLDRNVT